MESLTGRDEAVRSGGSGRNCIEECVDARSGGEKREMMVGGWVWPG